jgi:hypothetical protein
MPVKQGELQLLQHPASKELLQSKIPARLAYVWTDGTPRVVPIWFHWNEREFVLATPPKAPKLKALVKNPKVALTIDDNTFPHKVLLVRGTARLETVKGIVPEYAVAAERYFGSEQGKSCNAARLDDSRDGANHHYAGMGRSPRLPSPFPERSAAVSISGFERYPRPIPPRLRQCVDSVDTIGYTMYHPGRSSVHEDADG